MFWADVYDLIEKGFSLAMQVMDSVNHRILALYSKLVGGGHKLYCIFPGMLVLVYNTKQLVHSKKAWLKLTNAMKS